MLSRFSCVRFFVTLWTIAHQAPMSMDSPGKNAGVGCHALLWGIQQTHAYFPICPLTNSNPVLKGTTRSTWSSFLLHFQLALGDASGAQPSTTLWAASKFMRLNPLRLSTWLLKRILTCLILKSEPPCIPGEDVSWLLVSKDWMLFINNIQSFSRADLLLCCYLVAKLCPTLLNPKECTTRLLCP